MMEMIDADCVLANMLSLGWKEVSIKDLNHFRERFEKKAKNIFIDVTGACICMAIDQRPDMFVWNDTIRKKKGSELWFTRKYVRSYFNWRIPKGFKRIFVELCKPAKRRSKNA